MTYPALLAELMRRGWSYADAKLAGVNVLHVMAIVGKVAGAMEDVSPITAAEATLDAPAARP